MNSTSPLPSQFSPSTITPAWLNREQAAAYITRRVGILVTATILANKASVGNGPAYRIWGGKGGTGRGGRGRFAVYRPADLDAWIETQFHEPLAQASNFKP